MADDSSVAADGICPAHDSNLESLPTQPPVAIPDPFTPFVGHAPPPTDWYPPPEGYLVEPVRPGRHAAPRNRLSAQNGVFRPPPPLDEAVLFDRGTDAPQSGWRKAVHTMTAGRINPGPSPRDRAQAAMLARIAHPLDSDFRIAVLSIKGGVGKTTTTLGLGAAFALARTDRVIAIDANPDRGTLAQRVQERSTATVSGLLADPLINRYSDVRAHTRTSTNRLEVLGSDTDPSVADAFSEADYRRAVDVLHHYYSVILSDCGTGILHSAMAGVLDLAHAVVVVSAPALDSMKSAAATLKWLTLHGYSGLARESHLVISASRPGASSLQLDKVREHFQARCRSIHLIPFDPHLADGDEFDIELLKQSTREAYFELAAAVAEKFTGTGAAGPLSGVVR